jgi:hypothetical protein
LRQTTLLTQGFIEKNVLPSEFFQSSEQKSTNQSNLALSDNEKRLLNALAKTQNNKSEQPNSLKLLEKRFTIKLNCTTLIKVLSLFR